MEIDEDTALAMATEALGRSASKSRDQGLEALAAVVEDLGAIQSQCLMTANRTHSTIMHQSLYVPKLTPNPNQYSQSHCQCTIHKIMQAL